MLLLKIKEKVADLLLEYSVGNEADMLELVGPGPQIWRVLKPGKLVRPLYDPLHQWLFPGFPLLLVV